MAPGDLPNAFPASPLRFGRRAAVLTLTIATLLAVAQASQMFWAAGAFGRGMPWIVAFAGALTDTWLWAALVPGIFVLCRLFPLSTPRWPAHLAVHLGAAFVSAVLYSTLHTSFNEWLVPDDLQPAHYFRGPRPPRDGPPRIGPPPHPPPPSDQGVRPPPLRDPHAEPDFSDRVRFLLMRHLTLHLLLYSAVLGVGHWSLQQHRFLERERQGRELSRQLAEARLEALRMQLNPHFLFNTLNAIATLVHRQPKAADDMIACLSDFLRLTLGSANTPESPLHQELTFARRYLDIEKVRFGDRLTFEEDVEAACHAALVPTLVLQPILENAIRYGIEPAERQGTIRLSASRLGDRLILRIGDTGPGLDRGAAPRGAGIGLTNTRARLRELHGDDASLTLADRPQGGLEVEIQLPWRTTTTTASPSPAAPV
ncbi:MAG: sensor histidine kinase [Verrucomicrobiae bacterium]|nr:sensor histidine kinase [Verrucomicrobiae bacterium]